MAVEQAARSRCQHGLPAAWSKFLRYEGTSEKAGSATARMVGRSATEWEGRMSRNRPSVEVRVGGQRQNSTNSSPARPAEHLHGLRVPRLERKARQDFRSRLNRRPVLEPAAPRRLISAVAASSIRLSSAAAPVPTSHARCAHTDRHVGGQTGVGHLTPDVKSSRSAAWSTSWRWRYSGSAVPSGDQDLNRRHGSGGRQSRRSRRRLALVLLYLRGAFS
jgi:hypothetical protein